jgi:hypothetical protein
METVTKNVCRYEPVSQVATRYEYQMESQYVPPRLETLTQHRLRETEATCYAPEAAQPPEPPAPAPPPANRIEAVFYYPRAGEGG